MTLFLTGGTGFVGSHCARIFLAHGWRVRALVRRPERAGLLPGGVDVVQGHLGEPASYRESLKGCAAVIHCAASTSARNLAEFRRINVDGTAAIAAAAAAACPDAMFVHVSSQAAAGPARNGEPVRESDVPEPVSWYGRSKLESETAVARHRRGPWCVVRPSVVYGPGDAGLLQMFTVVSRGVAPIPAGGRRRVQLLAVEDLVRALFAAAQRPDLHGRCGFAAGETVSVGELVREIASLRTPHARAVPLPDLAISLLGLLGSVRGAWSRTARPFHLDKAREIRQADWLCDGEPLFRDLGITAGIGWREGLRDTCRWYVDARWLAPRAFAGL